MAPEQHITAVADPVARFSKWGLPSSLWVPLAKFLSEALQDAWTYHGRGGHATKQSTNMWPLHGRDGSREECDDMVSAKIQELYWLTDMEELYNENALAKHDQIFNVMHYNKQGKKKEGTFLAWCRNRQAAGASTQHCYKAY